MSYFQEDPNGKTATTGWRFRESYQERQMAYQEKARAGHGSRPKPTAIPRSSKNRCPKPVINLGYPKRMDVPNTPPNSFREDYFPEPKPITFNESPRVNSSGEKPCPGCCGCSDRINTTSSHFDDGGNNNIRHSQGDRRCNQKCRSPVTINEPLPVAYKSSLNSKKCEVQSRGRIPAQPTRGINNLFQPAASTVEPPRTKTRARIPNPTATVQKNALGHQYHYDQLELGKSRGKNSPGPNLSASPNVSSLDYRAGSGYPGSKAHTSSKAATVTNSENFSTSFYVDRFRNIKSKPVPRGKDIHPQLRQEKFPKF